MPLSFAIWKNGYLLKSHCCVNCNQYCCWYESMMYRIENLWIFLIGFMWMQTRWPAVKFSAPRSGFIFEIITFYFLSWKEPCAVPVYTDQWSPIYGFLGHIPWWDMWWCLTWYTDKYWVRLGVIFSYQLSYAWVIKITKVIFIWLMELSYVKASREKKNSVLL